VRPGTAWDIAALAYEDHALFGSNLNVPDFPRRFEAAVICIRPVDEKTTVASRFIRP
jgi:hypothetical protein